MSTVGIVLLIGAILCVGLCAYGITTAVRRSKDAHAPTRR
jgi:sulfite exporter TauE/SafE